MGQTIAVLRRSILDSFDISTDMVVSGSTEGTGEPSGGGGGGINDNVDRGIKRCDEYNLAGTSGGSPLRHTLLSA